MDVSVIIVNYNTCRMTADCIESVRQKTSGISYEIILVDNGSTDGSKDFFEQFEGIKYVYSEENLGFGRANNLGAKQASGDYLFLLNSDTLLINNAIKILYDYINTHQSVGVVGGNLFGPNGDARYSYECVFPGIYNTIDRFFKNRLSKLRFGSNSYFNHSNKAFEVAYISGADLMIKKTLFDELQGFDPRFFMYYEETELCARIRRKGMKVMSVPAAHIIHLEGSSTNRLSKQYNVKYNMFYISRNEYMNINHGRIYNIVDRGLMTLYLFRIMRKKKDERSKMEFESFKISYK